ncbi:MAG TPA: antibiotic biosynthesis monooxygenase [Steroidobacteraceae bacterium]|nr:antibiotic biosynthesis monooxygenase [Steroidobacteraceae bacterium]
MARFMYIWEFRVAPSSVGQFEFEYGPRGSWVALFRKAPEYIETLLLRDNTDPLRYVTVDRWESQKAHDLFRSTHLTQYQEIERRCRGYTTTERPLGEFSEGD